MVRLALLLLGVDYLRQRWRGIAAAGILSLVAGAVIFIDALNGVLYFPITIFACLFLLEGIATLVVAATGVGGRRALRVIKGVAVISASALILLAHEHGNFLLSMIFGTLFLADGMLQSLSAIVVRYRRWRWSLMWGTLEIAIALFFYQPYPTHYAGTVPYCLGLFLMFGGLNMLSLASRVKWLSSNPALNDGTTTRKTHWGSPQATAVKSAVPPKPDDATDLTAAAPAPASAQAPAPAAAAPAPASAPAPAASAQAPSPASAAAPAPASTPAPATAQGGSLIVHIWTPIGTITEPARARPVIDRYIAAVDIHGVISTGHAALESSDGIYISLYPVDDIDRSPKEFVQSLRATKENDVAGVFLTDYASEVANWCHSTVKIPIPHYDPAKLSAFWEKDRHITTYNLTHRNCSSMVAAALEAALDGAVGQRRGANAGWMDFFRILATPELWIAAQIRKRALTMAWTPGLTMDYARALTAITNPKRRH